MLKIIACSVKFFVACVIQAAMRLMPLNNRAIVFYAYKRKGLCCNPKYVMRYMLENYPNDYQYYWVAEFPETVPHEKSYCVVKWRSMAYYQLLARAKLLVTNDMADETLFKRKGQIYMSTWHGGGTYKKVGFDIKTDALRRIRLHRWYARLDFLILSNGFLAEAYKSSFRLREEQMLKTGMPRSDIFYRDNGMYVRIRERYRLDSDTKILLYAPTYRHGTYELLPERDLPQILEALTARFGGQWVCFYRMHYLDTEKRYEENEWIYNGNDYADAQEFLCAVDVLITDYSSLLWDFTLLGRPCFSYARNPGKYMAEERDFYLSYDEWPYPKAATASELMEKIRQFDEAAYQERLEEYIEKVDHYETGNSTERVVAWIRQMIPVK